MNLHPGETTEDLAITLETVNCVGACASAPVVVIDGDTFAAMTPGKVSKLAQEYRAKKD
jgi:NADH-quinone oxidoreductase subunit E